MTRTRSAALAALAASLLAGCPPKSQTADCSPTGVKSNVLATARSWYLFTDQVDYTPFDPADPTLSPQQFMDAIVAAAHAPDSGRGFSFLTTKAASTQFFDEGTSLGFGVGLHVAGGTQLFVTQVFGDTSVPPGSPAAQAGLARGDEILALAPTQAGLSDAASQMAAILALDATTPGTLSAAFSSSVAGTTRWFRVRHAGAVGPVDLSATTATYSLDPVPRSAAPLLLDVPAAASDTGAPKKVGYLMLRTFIEPAVPLLRQAFASLKANGVTDLIVDLRYDGGGRLDVAGTFIDLMSAGTTGSPKFELVYNAHHLSDGGTWFTAAEANALTPARVAFLMTRGSASASELLPFALSAFKGADVALVGETSFGKPAGQNSFASADCPDVLFLLSFQLTNVATLGEYFGGLPDAAWTGSSCAAADDLAHATGDPQEAMTGAALQWIADKTCAGGPIPLAPAAARRARVVAAPAPPEPSMAQRHVPGLY